MSYDDDDNLTADGTRGYTYDTFGRVTVQAGSGNVEKTNPFGFSTQYTDRESGLVYYGKRFYSPKLGRFINRDPLEEQGGLNFYCFVGNGPTNSWDVLGMFEMNDVFAPAPDDDELMHRVHPTWTKIDEDSWYDPERDIQFNYRGGGNEAVLYPDETAPIWEHGFDIWQADMARDAAFYRSADAAFDAFVASQPVADGVLLSGVGTTITHLLGRDKETGVATVTFGELTELSDEQDAYYRQRAAANAASSEADSYTAGWPTEAHVKDAWPYGQQRSTTCGPACVRNIDASENPNHQARSEEIIANMMTDMGGLKSDAFDVTGSGKRGVPSGDQGAVAFHVALAPLGLGAQNITLAPPKRHSI